MKYCATDVQATHDVFTTIWPSFLQHAPHPVTFSGMLEMGTAYLPIDESWREYTDHCEELYEKLSGEMRTSLMSAAEDALQKIVGNR